MGRHSWGDRGTHRKKQADTPRKTGRHTPERRSDRARQVDRGVQRSQGPQKPSGAESGRKMEQKVVGGGEAEPRIGGDCGLVEVPG